MVAKKPAVEIPVRIQKDQAQKDVKGLSSDMVKNFAKVGAGLLVLKQAFDVVGVAISGMVKISKQSIELAGVQLKAEKDLTSAIRQRQKFTDEEFASLQRFNSEVQQATAIGDESLLQLQKQLVLQGVEKQQLEEVTKAVIGLAQVKGQGLQEAATVVTRVLRGETGALKESGIVVKSVTEGLDRLIDNYQIATNETESFSGQLKLMNANLGDVFEEFGKTFTQSEEFARLMDAVNQSIIRLGSEISKNGSKISKFWDDMVTGAQDLTAILRDDRLRSAIDMLSYIPGLIPATSVVKGAIGAADFIAGTDEFNSQAISAYRMDQNLLTPAGIRRDPSVSTIPDVETADQKRAREQAQREQLKRNKERDDAHVLAMKAHLEEQHRLRGELALTGMAQDEAIRQRKYALREQDLLREAAFNDAQLAQTQAFYDNLAVIGLNGLGNMIANMVQAGLSGEQSLSEVMGRMFGAMLSQVGTMLISLGTATAMAAMASTPVPLLWGLTGGPAGVAAGFGLIAAGGVLTGVGQYVSSAGGATKSDLTKATGTARRMAPTSAADGGRRQQVTEETSTVYHINFNGALPGSERRIAKEMKRILSGDYSPAGAY